jgi:hypothetical protein
MSELLTAEERQAMRDDAERLLREPMSYEIPEVIARRLLRALDSDEAREQTAAGALENLAATLIDWQGRAQRQYEENVSLIAKLATAERERDEARALLRRVVAVVPSIGGDPVTLTAYDLALRASPVQP